MINHQKEKHLSQKKFSKLVDEIQNRTFNEFNSEGEGVKLFLSSKITDIYDRLEILQGLYFSCHSDTLTEASNLTNELYKKGEIQNEQQYRNALNKISTLKMELPSKILEQVAFNTRPKIEEHMLIVMDKSTHEEQLSQPLQTINKQFETAVTFLTGYKGIFKVTDYNNVYFSKSISDEVGSIQKILPKGAYKIVSLNKEIKRNIIDQCQSTEPNYSFLFKPNFSTLRNIIEISSRGPVITFS